MEMCTQDSGPGQPWNVAEKDVRFDVSTESHGSTGYGIDEQKTSPLVQQPQ